MSRQFNDVSSRYGAPMGRASYGLMHRFTARSVRLFRVRLDRGGYDDGGAYWGAGAPLYCAQDNDGEYRQFVRAMDRFDAAALLQLAPEWLARPVTLDSHYSVRLEWCGKPQPQWITRYRGDWLESNRTKDQAIAVALEHRREALESIRRGN